MNDLWFVPLILLFPILGLLISLAFGRWLSEKGEGIVACSAATAAFAVAVGALATLFRVPEGGEVLLWEWLRIGTLQIPMR